MKFTKMHGIGNDYVYVNCFEEKLTDPAAAARFVSDRHFGIGSDGLILICPSEKADVKMEMYNADGSRGAMCGNGIRCVAKYTYDHGLAAKPVITAETDSGIKTLELTVKDGKVSMVKVDMGAPILQASEIPVLPEHLGVSASPETNAGSPAENGGISGQDMTVINAPIQAGGTEYRITCVSMGNPHGIVFVPSVDDLPLEKIGPFFENHPAFPDRINTEFVEIVDAHTVKMRVWERGSGETLACGTGACAVAVACILNGRIPEDTDVTVKLLGGDLQIRWDKTAGTVFMTGPATEVFHGEIDLR